MAEEENGNEEFEQRFKAFNEAFNSQNWLGVVENANWLIENLPEDASDEIKIALYGNRGNAYSSLEQKRLALDD